MGECCCSSPGHADSTSVCPTCRAKGSPVDELTVKALLNAFALRRYVPGQYRFCADPFCKVVYFNGAGETFTTSDLRVSVWQKQPLGARTVCYCFGENEADIEAEVQRTGTSRAVERVRDHIQAGRCACEIRNPRGVCCLGDITQAVKRIVEHG